MLANTFAQNLKIVHSWMMVPRTVGGVLGGPINYCQVIVDGWLADIGSYRTFYHNLQKYTRIIS